MITGESYRKKQKVNTSRNKLPYQEYYDEETYKAVEDAYQRELDLFGYNRNGMKESIFDYPFGEKTSMLYIFCDDALIVNGKRLTYENAKNQCFHKWKIESYKDVYDSNKRLKEVPNMVRCQICGKLTSVDFIE